MEKMKFTGKDYGMRSNIIGYTTGVYDMFHIGHLNVIRSARKCAII